MQYTFTLVSFSCFRFRFSFAVSNNKDIDVLEIKGLKIKGAHDYKMIIQDYITDMVDWF